MKGEAKTLEWIKDKMFEVPFFQRPYVWNEDNWDELWESIKNSKNGEMPFIGSFILQEKLGEQPTKYLVIDGQQRLTTFSILIKAYLEFAKDIISTDNAFQDSFNRMEAFIKQDFSHSMRTIKIFKKSWKLNRILIQLMINHIICLEHINFLEIKFLYYLLMRRFLWEIKF